MPTAANREKIEALKLLSDSPGGQLDLVLDYIKKDRNTEVLLAAIRTAGSFDTAKSRKILIERFQRCQAKNGQSDPGALIRIEIIKALRPNLIVDDVNLLCSATLTYEYRPAESAGELRATGLVSLHDIDP